MDYRLLFPNDYIAAHDLRGKDVSKTIKAVTVEELRLTGGGKEKKPVLSFSDTKKRLVLNKTNAKSIAGQHGNDTAGWVGKKITLFPTTTLFGRNTVECVRIRERADSHTAAPVDEHPFDIETGEASSEDDASDDVDRGADESV